MQRAVVRLAIMLALVIGGAPTDGQAARGSRLVLGYYVPYDSNSWRTLQAHADALDIVAAQWATIDPCGNLSSREDDSLKEFAHARGLTIVPSLLTLSGWLNQRILEDEQVVANAIEQIVTYTVEEGYHGFDLDLEAVNPAQRDALSRFVARLASALHAHEKLLMLAIPAKDRDVRVGWSGAYDYTALGAAADLVTIMAYEYRGPFSGPGSVAPYDWVERVLAYATETMPQHKVLLGLAFYGYDWNTTAGDARSLGYAQAAAMAEHHGAAVAFDAASQSVTFSYETLAGAPMPRIAPAAPVAHTIRPRPAPPCDVVAPAPTAAPTRPPPAPGTPQQHEVWIEEACSAAARLELAERYSAQGVAMWRLGLEDPQLWPLLEQWRTAPDTRLTLCSDVDSAEPQSPQATVVGRPT